MRIFDSVILLLRLMYVMSTFIAPDKRAYPDNIFLISPCCRGASNKYP